ncbi:MAG: 4-hydroxy-3-methylbut-2-enyl diphosphate reductase [Candidatus Cloacimonadota bacterium]|nr:4-hydroxy-3-methylbut-2-enyl diphosphate reductase [Candidatus Cloacimonadota bacterium]
MNVRIAKNSGFCFGVKRAIKIALATGKKYSNVITLGPIIHNPQMVEKLRKNGIDYVENIAEIKRRPTIIRSHGVTKDILGKLKEKNIEIIDATCPYVSKTHNYAKELNEKGYQIIIMGDKNHPEVIALRSYVEGEAIIASHPSELPAKKFSKVAIISQTTRNVEDLQKMVSYLIPKSAELLVVNTICNATIIRQKSTLKLAKKSDLMIVIGGKNSSNTKMLAKISANFIETYHIEMEDELNEKWFKNKSEIGITAGASTPDWVILGVYNKILKYLGKKKQQVDKIEKIPGFKEEESDV